MASTMPSAVKNIRWPNQFQIQYNGYSFPGVLHSKVTAHPQYDSSDRVIKFATHLLHVEFIILPDDQPQDTSNTDVGVNVDYVRRRLLEAGATLRLVSLGFGDFVFDSSGSFSNLKEIDHGPKPRLLSWEPIGANKAVRVVWECEFSMAQCQEDDVSPGGGEDPKSRNGGFLEISWEELYSINSKGITTRIINATVEVPSSQRNQRAGTDNADRYREYFKVRLPANFRRVSQEYRLQRNRKILVITVTDEEVDSPFAFPKYFSNITATHRILSDGPAYVNFMNELRGTITVAPDYPKSYAFYALTLIVKPRLLAFQKQRKIKGEKKKVVTKKVTMIPGRIMLEEDIYGRELRFSFSWMLVADLGSFLGACGFMEAPGNDGWAAWRSSMETSTFHPRGFSKLKSDHDVNPIIGPCFKDSKFITPILYQPSTVEITVPNQSYTIYGLDPPPQDSSYIDYNLVIQESLNPKAVQHEGTGNAATPAYAPKPVEPTDDATTKPDATPNTPVSPGNVTSSPGAAGAKYYHPIQIIGPPSTEVTVEGYGFRAGYEVPVPTFQLLGGRKAILKDSKVKSSCIQASGTCPIYASRWRLTYILEESTLSKEPMVNSEGSYDSANRL